MTTVSKLIAAFLLCLIIPAHVQAAEVTLNKIAAVVNGEMISWHQLRKHTAAELSRQRIPQNDPRAKQAEKVVLDTMINDILLRQEAKRFNLTVSNSDIEEELKEMVARSGLTRKAFETKVQKEGSSVELIKEKISDNILRTRMISTMIVRKIVVSQTEIADYYNKNKEQFAGQKTIDFSVIMIPDKMQNQVQGIYGQLQSKKITFEDAARKHSADKSAERGGNIGKVPWDRLPPEMKKLMNTLSDGKMTPIMKTNGGFLIIKRNKLEDAKPETLEEAKPKIEQILKTPRLEERFKEYTEQLRGKAVIDIRI